MSDALTVLAVVGGILGVVGALGAALFLYSRARTRHREALEEVAADWGFSFQPEGAGLRNAEFADFPLLTRPLGFYDPDPETQCTNVLRGESGDREVVIFDHRYSTGGQTGAKQTVAAIRVSGGRTPLPRFSLEKKLLLGVTVFGKDGSVRFDEDSAFSSRFVLKGDDETALRALFDPALRGELAGLDARWTVEGGEEWVLAYELDRLVKPMGLKEFLEGAELIAGLLEAGGPSG